MKTNPTNPARRPTPATARRRRFLRTPHSVLRTPYSALSPAFTFVEVLFAIIILGIGMIMIAGILPVAIKQNSDTRDELTGKAVAEAGYAYCRTAIQQNTAAFVETKFDAIRAFDPNGDDGDERVGRVVPLNYSYVQATPALEVMAGLQSSRINSSDPRYQWLAFYRRDPNARVIQLIVMSMRLRNADPIDRYGPASTLNKESWDENQAGNGPFLVRCGVEDGGVEPDRLKFVGDTTRALQIAGPGAFVIVNHSPATTADPRRPFRNNGRIFRLANQRTDLDPSGATWDLDPAYDLPPIDIGPDGVAGTTDDVADASMSADAASAWMVGRGRTDPSQPADQLDSFGGLPQDITILKVDVPLQ